MKKVIILISALIIVINSTPCFAETAGSAVLIQYGVVENAQVIKKDASHAGGAMVGGLAALAFAGRRHRPLKIAASAAAGAAIQGAATSGTLQQYTVKLDNGNVIKVSTEQTDIRIGDCVTVEKGEHTNIRRVGSVNCEPVTRNETPAHHQSLANDCQAAKDELAKAKTNEELDFAIKKVRVLCE